MPPSLLIDYYLSHPWHMHAGTMQALDALLAARVEGRDINATELRDILGKDFAGRDTNYHYERDAEDDHLLPGGIAVIAVRGALARHADEVNGACMPRGRSYDTVIAQLAAAKDAGARAVVLRLETPGGIAVGAQECAEAITRTRAGGTPVYAYVDGYAFSAGYYLASACDEIVLSSKAAATGSIGTVMAFWDKSRAAEKMGMRRIVVRSGPRKALGQDGEAITDDVLADLQERIDAFFGHFRDQVQAGRNLTDEQIAAVSDGRIFDATAAITHGLADAIADWSTFLATITDTHSQETPMSIFGKNKSAQPDATATATDTNTEPPAAPATAAITAAAAMALAKSFPSAADVIAQLAADGKAEDEIQAAAMDAELKAERAAHAKTRTDLEAAQAKATAAEAKVAQLNTLGPASMQTASDDAGGDFTKGGATPGADASEKALREFYDHSPEAQATYAMGGFNAFAANCAAGIDAPGNYAG